MLTEYTYIIIDEANKTRFIAETSPNSCQARKRDEIIEVLGHRNFKLFFSHGENAWDDTPKKYLKYVQLDKKLNANLEWETL